jgi:hypothetical protein
VCSAQHYLDLYDRALMDRSNAEGLLRIAICP